MKLFLFLALCLCAVMWLVSAGDAIFYRGEYERVVKLNGELHHRISQLEYADGERVGKVERGKNEKR